MPSGSFGADAPVVESVVVSPPPSGADASENADVLLDQNTVGVTAGPALPETDTAALD